MAMLVNRMGLKVTQSQMFVNFAEKLSAFLKKIYALDVEKSKYDEQMN